MTKQKASAAQNSCISRGFIAQIILLLLLYTDSCTVSTFFFVLFVQEKITVPAADPDDSTPQSNAIPLL